MSLLFGLAATAVLSSATGQAAPPQTNPEVLARLLACRSIAESSARLACFDVAAGAMDTARLAGEVIVMDRAQVNQARRQLFGFDMPALPQLLGPEGSAEIDSIDTTLLNASQTGEGRWIFRLADGSVWRQVDDERVLIRNRAGALVQIRRAVLGSFLINVGGARAIRVRRQ